MFHIENNVIKVKSNQKISSKDIKQINNFLDQGMNELHLSRYFKYDINELENLDKLEILHLCGYSQKISKLPRNLKEFYCGEVFNQNINENFFPNSLEKIVFSYCFNSTIEKYPDNLKHLEFGKSFNKPINNLPDKLEELYLFGDFNQTLDNLPSNLKIISLFGLNSCKFNHPINNLPLNLQELFLSGEFNQSIDFLPINLKTLYINSSFNHTIDNLPIGLHKIFFSNYSNFNNRIDNLPDTIEEIVLPDKYDIMINKLPRNLKKIKINKNYPYMKNLNEKFQYLFEKNIIQFYKKTIFLLHIFP